MRLALFESSGVLCSVPLDKVLHILTDPQIFSLPLLRPCFSGGILYQRQVLPLLAEGPQAILGSAANRKHPFVLVCEAEYGLVGIPADRVLRITKAGEVDVGAFPEHDPENEQCEINGRDCRLLDLNKVMDDSSFTICGLKD